jgi:hypothetical protein
MPPPLASARDWAGPCAFVLACGLALGWAGALLLAAWRGGPISDHGTHLLATLGGAMAGAVATYLGSTLHHTDQGADAGPPAPPDPADGSQ